MYDGPNLDHGPLSPSGSTSKAARNAALETARRELFGDGLERPHAPALSNAAQAAILMQHASDVRRLADMGMGPRKHRREAARLEALAQELLSKEQTE